jgi:metal iron transporter
LLLTPPIPSQPLVRRLLTRLLGLIPSMIVAVAVGRPGINAMLIASQVVLSLVLPFIVFPLVWLTSSSTVMRVRAPTPARPTQKEEGAEEDINAAEDVYLYFNNGRVIAGLGYGIWAVIVVANAYALITLALGDA